MKDPFILKILDLFSIFFREDNFSYEKIRLILKLKFHLDRRKAPMAFRNIGQKPGKDRNLFLYSMFFYGIMGLMLLAFIAAVSSNSLLLGSITFFTVLMVFISYAIIIEFSMDFFDTSDHTILLSKPFKLQELNIAKSLHIFIYMAGIAMTFSLPTLVFWAIQYNVIISLISVILILLCLLFLFFCCAIFYGIILNNFSGEKLKDTISLVQIISVIVIFLGYQIFAQTSMQWLMKFDIYNIPVWLYFLPPTWFALPGFMIGTGFFDFPSLIVSLVGIIITIAGYRHYIVNLSPAFEKNLYKLKLIDTKIYKKREPLNLKFSFFFKSNIDKAFYRFSVLMMNRERKLKQAIYPLIAMGMVFPILMIYKLSLDPNTILSKSKLFFFLYYNMMMILPLSIYTNYSEFYKASWIYSFLPVKSPGSVIKMAKTAMLLSYQMLVMGFSCLLFLVIWKFTIIPDVIIIWLNALILQFLYENMSKKVLPFSIELKTGQNNAFKHLTYFLAVFVLTPLLGGSHFAARYFFPSFYWLLIIIQVALLWIIYKNHYKISWNEITQ